MIHKLISKAYKFVRAPFVRWRLWWLRCVLVLLNDRRCSSLRQSARVRLAAFIRNDDAGRSIADKLRDDFNACGLRINQTQAEIARLERML